MHLLQRMCPNTAKGRNIHCVFLLVLLMPDKLPYCLGQKDNSHVTDKCWVLHSFGKEHPKFAVHFSMLGFAFAMVKAQITLSNRPFIIFYLSGVYINSNLNEFAGFIVTLQKYLISVTF